MSDGATLQGSNSLCVNAFTDPAPKKVKTLWKMIRGATATVENIEKFKVLFYKTLFLKTAFWSITYNNFGYPACPLSKDCARRVTKLLIEYTKYSRLCVAVMF